MAKTAESRPKTAKRDLARPYQCNVLLSLEEDQAVSQLSIQLKKNKSDVVRLAIMKLHAKEVGKK
jgi:hypothetical protein